MKNRCADDRLRTETSCNLGQKTLHFKFERLQTPQSSRSPKTTTATFAPNSRECFGSPVLCVSHAPCLSWSQLPDRFMTDSTLVMVTITQHCGWMFPWGPPLSVILRDNAYRSLPSPCVSLPCLTMTSLWTWWYIEPREELKADLWPHSKEEFLHQSLFLWWMSQYGTTSKRWRSPWAAEFWGELAAKAWKMTTS